MVFFSLGISGPPAELVRRVTVDFGLQGLMPVEWEQTSSGGWRSGKGVLRLSIDANGSVRELKIQKVRFEASDAKSTRAKIGALLKRYPLPLGEGKWVTERSLAPHPYGDAKTSMRYFFVPMRHGYPFLKGSLMTAQVSHDQKRVLEWSYHPWAVPACRKPGSFIDRKTAMAKMVAESARRSTGGLKYKFGPKTFMLGWLSPTDPRLVYVGISTAPIDTPRGPSLTGFGMVINAETGKFVVK